MWKITVWKIICIFVFFLKTCKAFCCFREVSKISSLSRIFLRFFENILLIIYYYFIWCEKNFCWRQNKKEFKLYYQKIYIPYNINIYNNYIYIYIYIKNDKVLIFYDRFSKWMKKTYIYMCSISIHTFIFCLFKIAAFWIENKWQRARERKRMWPSWRA